MAVDRIDELRTAAIVNTVLELNNTTGTVMSIPIFSLKKFRKVFLQRLLSDFNNFNKTRSG